jgi:D-arabinose 1-dehydrogenase-like Zn-dependent alcohol dehydrogenase
MAKMRAIEVREPKGPLQLVEREVPEARAGEVRVKIQACGICHSDTYTKDALYPGIRYPRVPGHEVVGVVDAVGAGVQGWRAGERIGVGWHGGNCGYCDNCRRGDAFACETETLITGITSDGGYADYMLAPASALARVPDELGAVEAAPLLCAGVTTFNALRHSGAGPGETVAVLGLGGLGHLGVQFAAKLGFRTIAIARGQDKLPLARQLGAHEYIDNAAEDPAAALQKLGGAKAILATATSAEAMNSVQGGLGINGVLLVIGAVPALSVDALELLRGRRSVKGWYSGIAIDSEETLAFSALAGVRPMIEVFPLERAAEGYERMLSGGARFRVVLTTGN